MSIAWLLTVTNQSLLALEEEGVDHKWEVCRFLPELPRKEGGCQHRDSRPVIPTSDFQAQTP